MTELQEKILALSSSGLTASQISKTIPCASSTVFYYLNPESKEHILSRRRQRNKNKLFLHPYLDKEINIEIKKVDWRHAEAVCLTRLIELGYEVFVPFNGGGEIDLIAYKDFVSYRIQIKSVSPIKKEYICIPVSRQISNRYLPNRSTLSTKPYENIDFYMIYDGTNIYKINFDKNITNITLRYKVPANQQIIDIKMARDYIL